MECLATIDGACSRLRQALGTGATRRRAGTAKRWAAHLLATALGTGLLSACEPKPEPQRYSIRVRVISGSGQPLPAASLLRNGVSVADSGSDGLAAFDAVGVEGETIAFRAQCPAGYRSPERPLAVVLRTFTERVSPEYDVVCVQATNVLIVAVAAKGGENLPIRYLDAEVGRTSSHGAGHVRLELPAGQNVELVLDTRQRPELQPQNPVAHFVVGESSHLAVFKQDFSVKQDTKAPVRSSRPAAQGPVRIH